MLVGLFGIPTSNNILDIYIPFFKIVCLHFDYLLSLEKVLDSLKGFDGLQQSY